MHYENRKRYFKYLGTFLLKYVIFGVVIIGIARILIDAKYGDKIPDIIRSLDDLIHAVVLCALIKINKHVDLVINTLALFFGILLIYWAILAFASNVNNYIYLGIGLLPASFILLRIWWNGINDYDKEDSVMGPRE